MKPPANPVTVEDAAKFAGYITTWQAKLNLNDWRILPGGKVTKGNCADISISVPDHCAVYRLGAHFGSEAVTDHALESTAVHELLHVICAEYRDVVLQKPGDDLVNAAEHRIVHTLERLLVPKP